MHQICSIENKWFGSNCVYPSNSYPLKAVGRGTGTQIQLVENVYSIIILVLAWYSKKHIILWHMFLADFSAISQSIFMNFFNLVLCY